MSAGTAKPLYPVYLDVAGRLCVVIGGGDRAERKAQALMAAGGDVVVVGSNPSESMLQAGLDGLLTVAQRGYVRGDLEGAFLALAIGQPAEIARAIADEATERGCLVNVSGHPELCSFVIPTIVARGGLQVAVSTGGAAPAAAKQAVAAIGECLGEEWGKYTDLLAGVRTLVLERGFEPVRRTELLSQAAAPEVLERLRSGEKLTPRKLLAELEKRSAAADGAVTGQQGAHG